MEHRERIEAMERLQQLRASGALTDAEFEAEKHKILSASSTERPPAKWNVGIIVGASLALVCAIAVAWALTRPPATQPPVKAPVVQRPPKQSAAEALASAFELATGHKGSFAHKVEGQNATTSPAKLIELPFGPVLLTSTEIADGCHACTGSVGVYYLERRGNLFVVKGKWPDAVHGWGWGAPPSDWSITDKFTSYPAIYAEGGYTGQGYSCGSATLTELLPDGPVTSDLISLSSSNSGAVLDNGTTYGGDPLEELQGKITNIVRDQSFEVAVSGPRQIRERYARKGGKFVRVSSETALSC